MNKYIKEEGRENWYSLSQNIDILKYQETERKNLYQVTNEFHKINTSDMESRKYLQFLVDSTTILYWEESKNLKMDSEIVISKPKCCVATISMITLKGEFIIGTLQQLMLMGKNFFGFCVEQNEKHFIENFDPNIYENFIFESNFSKFGWTNSLIYIKYDNIKKFEEYLGFDLEKLKPIDFFNQWLNLIINDYHKSSYKKYLDARFFI